jgi:hypothetical protein
MITARRFSISRSASTALLSLLTASWPSSLFAQEPSGTLRLTINDATTGQPVPARVEIQGADGTYQLAEDALPASGDCGMDDPGSGPVDQAASLAKFFDRVRISNPYTGTKQFYSTGESSIRLPAGTATIRVFKGPEYKVRAEKIEIPRGATVEHQIVLTRWINMPTQGWYSADDHLHIPRPSPESNAPLSKMLQAEDINVGTSCRWARSRISPSPRSMRTALAAFIRKAITSSPRARRIRALTSSGIPSRWAPQPRISTPRNT